MPREVSIHLDHVSVTCRTDGLERLGFRVTPTIDVEHHSRVLLDGMYLEVTAPSDARDQIAAVGWSIRPNDLDQTAERLQRSGFDVSGPHVYNGRDGTWLDAEILEPGLGMALPLLTRRSDVPADTWPPRLQHQHPNGAHRITEIHLRTSDAASMARILGALGLRDKGNAFVLTDDVAVFVDESPGIPTITSLQVARDDAVPLELEFAEVPL